MSKNLKLSLGIAALFLVVIAAAALFSDPGQQGGQPAAAGEASTPVVRPDSHRLATAADGKVTLVEFLDFECESCAAAFPVVEQLRERYAGKVTFVIRYFPLDGHRNAEPAALAVEAAAQQGKLEAMYRKMYDTQTEWGEQTDSKAGVFRGFAAELGLDLAAYDRVVADPATAQRVQRDRDDGLALGVRGTPTFFLNGQRLDVRSAADLEESLRAAVGS